MSKALKKSDPENIYVLTEKMGSGSYGTVWKATKKGSQLLYAIKIVRKNGQQAGEEVIKEVKFLISCDHENIVQYHESYEKNDDIWVWHIPHS